MHNDRRYKVVKQLGDGTYGTVWKAINRQTNEVVSTSPPAPSSAACSDGAALAYVWEHAGLVAYGRRAAVGYGRSGWARVGIASVVCASQRARCRRQDADVALAVGTVHTWHRGPHG